VYCPLFTHACVFSYYENRKRVLDVCKKIFAGGLVLGTDGNVSERIVGTDLMAIKGSGIPYEELAVNDIVVCKLDGTRIPGERKPSSEVGLHAGMYLARSDVNGVVHTHSTYASIIACCRLDIPCFHYSVAEIAAETDVIKCAKYFTYGTLELAKSVIEAVGPTRAGCLMANHGQVCVGEDLDAAFYFAMRLENLCLQYAQVLSIGSSLVLSKEDMDACRERDKTYGQVEEGGTGHGLGCCK